MSDTDMSGNGRKRFLLRLYELMLALALVFATVPFVKSCLSSSAPDRQASSVRLSQVSIGGTLRLPGERPGEVVFVYRQRERQFVVFSLSQDRHTGSLFPDSSLPGCEQVRVAYNRIECSRPQGDISWTFDGAPSQPDVPALPVLHHRVDNDRLYYGSGA